MDLCTFFSNIYASKAEFLVPYSQNKGVFIIPWGLAQSGHFLLTVIENLSLFSIICSMILTFHKHVLLKCILFPPLLYISVVSILLSTVRSSMSMLTKLLICSNSELSQTKVISSPTHKNFRPMLHVLASNHGSYGSMTQQRGQ